MGISEFMWELYLLDLNASEYDYKPLLKKLCNHTVNIFARFINKP